SDDTRLRAVLPTIRYALTAGAAVVLASHLGRPKGKTPEYSMRPVAERLGALLGHPVELAPDCVGPETPARARALRPGEIRLLALGHAVGRSLVEVERVETARAALETARRRGVRVVLPVDVLAAEGLDSPSGRTVGVREIPADHMGLDIGPRTVEAFAAELRTARTIAWNGPMGVFEKAPFAGGTVAVARAVASAPAFSVIGGGDTIAAVAQAGVTDRIGYISTAGGAFLEYLEGRKLPGVEALAEAA